MLWNRLSKRLKRRSLLAPTAISIALLTGCAGTPSHVVNLEQSLTDEYEPLKEEVWAEQQADIVHDELVSRGLLLNAFSPEVSYLREMKSHLMAGSGYGDQIQVYLVRAADPNAFALPNGNIYIHSGLFTSLDDPNQLAAVLAHEVSHVVQRHGLKSVIAQKNALVGAHVADLLTGGLGLVYWGTVASIMNYSREQELEADRDAVELLKQSGYPSSAAISALEAIFEHPLNKHGEKSIYNSHPHFDDRVAALRPLSAASNEGVSGPEDAQYRSIREQMVELNLKLHLRHRQFVLAETIVRDNLGGVLSESQQAMTFSAIKLGVAKYPEDAAKEQHWLDTGKMRAPKALIEQFESATDDNLDQAIQMYREIIDSPRAPVPVAAHKKLAEAYELRGFLSEAAVSYQQYLAQAPEAKDRRFVEYRLQQIQTK